MIAEYTVKRNGKWYKAGDEIPDIVLERNLPEGTPRQRLTE